MKGNAGQGCPRYLQIRRNTPTLPSPCLGASFLSSFQCRGREEERRGRGCAPALSENQHPLPEATLPRSTWSG